MALDNKNIAYDLSLFEESPKQTKKSNNVLRLPESQPRKRANAKKFYKTVAVLISAVSLSAIVVGTMLYGQVQLTEVTEGINMATKQLNESESIYTQLRVKVESKLSLGAVENYAKSNLKMEKINPYQIEYISLSSLDKGEVSQKGLNMFDKIHKCLHKN